MPKDRYRAAEARKKLAKIFGELSAEALTAKKEKWGCWKPEAPPEIVREESAEFWQVRERNGWPQWVADSYRDYAQRQTVQFAHLSAPSEVAGRPAVPKSNWGKWSRASASFRKGWLQKQHVALATGGWVGDSPLSIVPLAHFVHNLWSRDLRYWDQDDEHQKLFLTEEQIALVLIGLNVPDLDRFNSPEGFIDVVNVVNVIKSTNLDRRGELVVDDPDLIANCEKIEKINTAQYNNIFRRSGKKTWRVVFEGKSCEPIEHIIGMALLAELLSRPGKKISAWYLYNMVKPSTIDIISNLIYNLVDQDLQNVTSSLDCTSADVLDKRAINEYRNRLKELKEDLDAAYQKGQTTDALTAEREIALISAQLEKDTHMGHAKKFNDHREKVRKAVQGNINRARKHIENYLPALARHLRSPTLTCGHQLCYHPESTVKWDVSPTPSPPPRRS